jgi:U3 small nucleolar RNA-associated protein 11
MSSLRNAVKRITHKERSQPRHRAHLGLLEKKKDYKERAIDYHKKEDRVKAMQQRAAMRNPDEFYFGMHSAQVQEGHHRKTQQAQQKEFEKSIGHDTIRLMKDQDLKYIRMQTQKDVHKIEKLQSSLHLLGSAGSDAVTMSTTIATGKKRKHTVFVESARDVQQFDVADHFDTVPELVGRVFNRPRKAALQQQQAAMSSSHAPASASGKSSNTSTGPDVSKHTAKVALATPAQARMLARQVAKEKAASYRELQARTQRVKDMKRAEAHLLTQKWAASKGRKRLIRAAEGGQPAQYKWSRRRLD